MVKEHGSRLKTGYHLKIHYYSVFIIPPSAAKLPKWESNQQIEPCELSLSHLHLNSGWNYAIFVMYWGWSSRFCFSHFTKSDALPICHTVPKASGLTLLVSYLHDRAWYLSPNVFGDGDGNRTRIVAILLQSANLNTSINLRPRSCTLHLLSLSPATCWL